MMRLRCIIWLLLGLFTSSAFAQYEPLVIRSRSDQFIVFGMPSARSQLGLNSIFDAKAIGEGHVFWLQPNSVPTPEQKKIRLEPQLVAVSCERIKEALLRELRIDDSRVYNRIYLQINNRIAQRNTRIVADRYERGWVYAVDIAPEVDEHFFSATVLKVLLYELANRNSPDKQIDLPAWLVNGLVAHLQATTLQSLALKPNFGGIPQSVTLNPLTELRKTFENDLPLSFEELCWPGTVSKGRTELYRDSAHFFVHQLLAMPGGRESLRQFIFSLERHHNWQFAFLSSFKKQFGDLVEVEKWWSVNFVHFMGRDASQQWPEEESWRQLKAALDVTMDVRLDANRLPVTAEYNLQEAISKWDYARQDLAITKAISQLRVLRFRSHSNLRPIVDNYRKVLEDYLAQRGQLGRSAGKNEVPLSGTFLKKQVCRQLDALDDERARLRQEYLSSQSASR